MYHNVLPSFLRQRKEKQNGGQGTRRTQQLSLVSSSARAYCRRWLHPVYEVSMAARTRPSVVRSGTKIVFFENAKKKDSPLCFSKKINAHVRFVLHTRPPPLHQTTYTLHLPHMMILCRHMHVINNKSLVRTHGHCSCSSGLNVVVWFARF